jgi:hypothetical protein
VRNNTIRMSKAGESTMTTPQPDKPRRPLRWYQFSLRTLLVLVLLASVGMSWFAVRMQRARKQREVVAAIVEMGGRVTYDYDFDASGNRVLNPKPPGPAWLRKLLGDDFFANVTCVGLGEPETPPTGLEYVAGVPHVHGLHPDGTQVTDAGSTQIPGLTQPVDLHAETTSVNDAALEHLKGFTRLRRLYLVGPKVTDAALEHLKGLTELQSLDLTGTPVSDAGLEHLKGLTQLQILELDGTNVTDVGVEDLQKALPNVKIHF